MSDCIFCKIATGEIPSYKVYEDDNVLAFLDHTPVNAGHTLVIPKKHFNTFLDLPSDLVGEIMSVISKISPAVVAGSGAQGFNLNLNNGETSGQVVFHAHWHIIPRYKNDGLKHWTSRDYSAGEAEEVLEKIKKIINSKTLKTQKTSIF